MHVVFMDIRLGCSIFDHRSRLPGGMYGIFGILVAKLETFGRWYSLNTSFFDGGLYLLRNEGRAQGWASFGFRTRFAEGCWKNWLEYMRYVSTGCWFQLVNMCMFSTVFGIMTPTGLCSRLKPSYHTLHTLLHLAARPVSLPHLQ